MSADLRVPAGAPGDRGDEHLEAALASVARGWQVFPVYWIVDGRCACGGPCDSPGKHPITSNGFKAATDDEQQIRSWWATYTEANVGVATGSGSGIWVLDKDTRQDGLANFETIRDGRELKTVEQTTGSGGGHLVFAWPSGLEVRNRTNVVPGVDVRGEGGYIIVPPSNHLSGHRYAWVERRSPDDLDPTLAPDWLLELVLAESSARRAGRVGDQPDIELAELSEQQLVEIRSALDAIDPNCDHETWYRIGMALHSTHAGEPAFELWDDWSSGATRARGDGQGPVYPGTDALRKRWRSFGRRDNEVGLGTLFWLAKESGWVGSNSAELDLTKLNLTHKSVGRLLLRRHGSDMRFCHPWKKWLLWDSQRWKEDDKARALYYATTTQEWLKRLIGDEFENQDAAARPMNLRPDASGSAESAPAEGDDESAGDELEESGSVDDGASVLETDRPSDEGTEGGSEGEPSDGDAAADDAADDAAEDNSPSVKKLKELWKQVLRFEAVPSRRQALESASWEPSVPIVPDDLNRHPLLLSVVNGTLDLETLKLREHRREDLITQVAPVAFVPAAPCPRFLAFIEEAFPEPELRSFVQRAFGYSLTGLVDEHILLFLYGHGKNGKSTLLNALLHTLGPDLSGPASPKLLVNRGRDEHPTEIADLFGKRLVVCSESGEGSQLDEEKVKLLTGGDLLKARRMREDLWSFQPTHTLWFQSNYLPRIRGTDEGIWRRVLQVPFTTQPRKVDPGLGRSLRAEASGILNWGVAGLGDYLKSGLAPPSSVLSATARYRAEQDVVARFMAECVKPEPGHRVRARAMFNAYFHWCDRRGEQKKSETEFGKDLERRGLAKTRSNGIWYLDVRFVG